MTPETVASLNLGMTVQSGKLKFSTRDTIAPTGHKSDTTWQMWCSCTKWIHSSITLVCEL